MTPFVTCIESCESVGHPLFVRKLFSPTDYMIELRSRCRYKVSRTSFSVRFKPKLEYFGKFFFFIKLANITFYGNSFSISRMITDTKKLIDVFLNIYVWNSTKSVSSIYSVAWNVREGILGYKNSLTQLQNLFLFPPRRPKVIQLSTQTEREVTGRMNYSSETVASRRN